MKFIPTSMFNSLARGSGKEIRFKIYARKTASLAGAIPGTSGWTDVTNRVELSSLPDARSQIEYELGQFGSDSITLKTHDVQWWKTNFLSTNIRLPQTIYGLKLWLDASKIQNLSDAAAVGTWLDQSGNKMNAVQATAGKKPLFKTNQLNGLPVVRFDGVDDFMSIPSLPLNTQVTVFVVAKFTTAKPMLLEHSVDANSNDGFYFFGSNTNSWLLRRTASHSGAGIASWMGSAWTLAGLVYTTIGSYYKGGAVQSNGTITGTARPNTSVTQTLYIASRAGTSTFGDGDIAELIVFNRSLTDLERQSIEYYLSAKYNLSIPGTLSDDYVEMKVEAQIVGAADVIPYFAGFVDKVGAEAVELSNSITIKAFTPEDIGSRMTGEYVSAKPINSNAGGAGPGLILANITGTYVLDAALAGYELTPGTHILNYDYNGGGGNQRINLDGGAWKTIGAGGVFTVGNVDHGAGDTQRVKIISGTPWPVTSQSDKIIVLNFGETIPRHYYKDVQARYILTKLYNQIGITSLGFDTLEFTTWDGAKRLFYVDTPPNNDGDVYGVKDAIETDGTNLFIAKDTMVYKRDMLTGVYTTLTSALTQSVEKLMYSNRAGDHEHLWIYGGGYAWRYDLTAGTLSSAVTLNATATELSHYGIQVFDYNYTGSSWKYGLVYADKNSGTSSGLFRFLDSSTMTVSTIVTGATLTDTIYPYFTYIMAAGKVRFRVFNNVASKHCYWEYQVNSSGTWVSNGEKLSGLDDYRVAAYDPVETRVYYAFDAPAGNYLTLRSHTDASITTTDVYVTSDGSAVKGALYYSATDGNVYYTFDEAIGQRLYSAAANVNTFLYDGIYSRTNQMAYVNSRLYLLNQGGGIYFPSYYGIGLYQWSDQCVVTIPRADFDGTKVTDNIRKVLNAFLFVATISPLKKAYVYRRGDSTGVPQTTGNTISLTVKDAEDLVEIARAYPRYDIVEVTNGVTTYSYDGVSFNRTVLGDARKLTINNDFIHDQIVKDVAYYAFQFFKIDRAVYRIPTALVTLWQYEPFDAGQITFTTTNIQETNSGPIYGMTMHKDGSTTVEVLL